MLPEESAETAARRVLAVETGIRDLSRLHLEQLRTYSEPDRDPECGSSPSCSPRCSPTLPSRTAAVTRRRPAGCRRPAVLLAFDHYRILADAHERVGAELEYTCLATSFCRPEFTLGELQRIYETVWGAVLDRPNFRRKVRAMPGFVAPVPGAARLTGGRGKPAALYRAGGATALQPPLLRPPSEGRP